MRDASEAMRTLYLIQADPHQSYSCRKFPFSDGFASLVMMHMDLKITMLIFAQRGQLSLATDDPNDATGKSI